MRVEGLIGQRLRRVVFGRVSRFERIELQRDLGQDACVLGIGWRLGLRAGAVRAGLMVTLGLLQRFDQKAHGPGLTATTRVE